MSNSLSDDFEYEIEETPKGTWRRYYYATGEIYAEFTSHRRLFGLPLLHKTMGRSPETGRLVTAHGIIAIGRFARGFVAIGQVAMGVIALGQLAVGIVAFGQAALGLMLGFGQLATGVFVGGQVALGVLFAIGQFATGWIAIGQTAFGHFVLAARGWGTFVWDQTGSAPEAEEFFRSFCP